MSLYTTSVGFEAEYWLKDISIRDMIVGDIGHYVKFGNSGTLQSDSHQSSPVFEVDLDSPSGKIEILQSVKYLFSVPVVPDLANKIDCFSELVQVKGEIERRSSRRR